MRTVTKVTKDGDRSHGKRHKRSTEAQEEHRQVLDKLKELLCQTVSAEDSDPTTEEPEGSKPLSSVWRKFRAIIYEQHPELPESSTPKISYRTGGSSMGPVAEPLKLTFHPAVLSAVEACKDAVFQPISKSGQAPDPLPVGESQTAQRSFLHKDWDMEGDYQLSTHEMPTYERHFSAGVNFPHKWRNSSLRRFID